MEKWGIIKEVSSKNELPTGSSGQKAQKKYSTNKKQG
jgi:hypothetical protein